MRWTTACLIATLGMLAWAAFAAWCGPRPAHHSLNPNPAGGWVDALCWLYCELVFAGMIWLRYRAR